MSRQKIIIIAASMFLLLCIVLIIITATTGKEVELEQVHYTLDFPLVLPAEPGYSGDYLFTNTPKERWTEDEVSQWFTEPNATNLDKLSSANDQLILKILEAAP